MSDEKNNAGTTTACPCCEGESEDIEMALSVLEATLHCEVPHLDQIRYRLIYLLAQLEAIVEPYEDFELEGPPAPAPITAVN